MNNSSYIKQITRPNKFISKLASKIFDIIETLRSPIMGKSNVDLIENSFSNDAIGNAVDNTLFELISNYDYIGTKKKIADYIEITYRVFKENKEFRESKQNILKQEKISSSFYEA